MVGRLGDIFKGNGTLDVFSGEYGGLLERDGDSDVG